MQRGESSHTGKNDKGVVLDVDSLVHFMEERVHSTRGKPSCKSTIFRVPEDIRNDDAAAYSPKVVSIGLLQQEMLGQLDEHKWHYLDKVLSRGKEELARYTKEMANIAHAAASCYSGGPDAELGDYAIKMLLDGYFIINLLLQLEDGMVEINDPIYKDRWTLPRVAHDMLLLENQLPFVVLEKLWELTGRESPTLKTTVLEFFRYLLPEEHDRKLPEKKDVHHLLHLMHLSLQPVSSGEKPDSRSGATIPHPPQPSDTIPSTKNSSFETPKPLQPASPTEKSESTSGSTITHPPQPSDTLSNSKSSPSECPESHQPTAPMTYVKTHAWLITSTPKQIPSAPQTIKISEPMRRPPPPKTIPSATELQEAGVKFRQRKAKSFLDVTFKQGLMQLPRLTISGSTNSLFRNFIAFEQGFPDCGSYFTSYCIFMDSLINTPRDVEILKHSGIIEHVLGSDEEVALLFNKLSKGITWDYEHSYLADVYINVEKHTQKEWPKWRARLVRDYFSNPWAILSLIAAIVILILTFLQTYFAVFAYFRPP